MIRQFFLLLTCTPFMAMSQVGVGTNNVHPSAKLQVDATNKGFLQPRVALTGNTDVTTIANPATGLTVYNTATAGSGATAITPGVHYFDGTRWVRMESSVINAGTGTTVTGNGTIASPYVVNSTGGGSTPVTFVTGRFSNNDQVFNRFYGVNADGNRYFGPSIRIGSITLPEGKWEVTLHTETWPSTLGQLGTNSTTQGNCQIKLQFWIQNDQTDNQIVLNITNGGGRTFNSQTLGGYPASTDTLLWGSAAFTFTLKNGTGPVGTAGVGIVDANDSYCKGSFLINNTSGGNKTYFVYASELFGGCTAPTVGLSGTLPGYFVLNDRNYPSNRLYATKIN